MDRFCTVCGAEMENGVCPRCSRSQINPNDQKLKRIFVNEKEKFVCALGTNLVKNFLARGDLGNGFAVVSDKRIYFKGKSYEVGSNKLKARNVASTVDLKDITGTEVRSFKSTWSLVLAWLCVILVVNFLIAVIFERTKVTWTDGLWGGFFLILAIVFFIFYFLSRKTVLTIMFGGGGIAFPLNWYPVREGENFQKQLRIAKDNAIEESENAAANSVREAMANASAQQPEASAADELAKYAQLYKDGMISEQEFTDIKAKLLAKQ